MADDDSPLTEYLSKMSSDLAPKVIASIKKQIDIEANKCFEKMRDGTPVRTGALKSSLRMKKIDRQNKYGYSIDYEGYNSKGQPYSEIARSLNKGGKMGKFSATHHIDVAVHLLKGMDDRIVERIDDSLKEGDK